MAEEKITAEVKVKNPKRVEAGKKLAALSKAARERKKLDRENKTVVNGVTVPSYTTLGVMGLLVAMGSLWFTYKSYTKKPVELAKHVKEEPLEVKQVNLESL